MARAAVRTEPALAADLVELVKPGILIFSLLAAAVGYSLAPGGPELSTWIPLLLGTALIVGSANALNMYLERDIDCHMARTKSRPLPAGRMAPAIALYFGIALAVLALPILTFGVHPITGLLGAVAFVSYVFLYTPLKQRTPLSTLVGAIPGAMPVLMGWVAATGDLSVAGLTLFAFMVVWQIPHFLAITLFRGKEYRKAGLKVLPEVRGARVTRYSILLYLAVQIQLSLMLYPLGVAGQWYLVAAAVLGTIYFVYAVRGVRDGDARWARKLFLISIAYLPLLFIALVANGLR